MLVLLAGCGSERPADEPVPPRAREQPAECIARPTLADGRTLKRVYQRPVRALPAKDGSVPVTWGCPGLPPELTVRRGIPASVAVFTSAATYFSPDIPLQSSANPLRPYYYRSAGRLPRSCEQRTITGTIDGVDNRGIVRVDGIAVSVVPSTALRTPTVDGIPRVRAGTPVEVRALRCRGRKHAIARSISAR